MAELQSQIDSLNPSKAEQQILIVLLDKAWDTRKDLEKLSANLQSELNDERQLQDGLKRIDQQLPLKGIDELNKDQVKQLKKQQLPELKVNHFYWH